MTILTSLITLVPSFVTLLSSLIMLALSLMMVGPSLRNGEGGNRIGKEGKIERERRGKGNRKEEKEGVERGGETVRKTGGDGRKEFKRKKGRQVKEKIVWRRRR